MTSVTVFLPLGSQAHFCFVGPLNTLIPTGFEFTAETAQHEGDSLIQGNTGI